MFLKFELLEEYWSGDYLQMQLYGLNNSFSFANHILQLACYTQSSKHYQFKMQVLTKLPKILRSSLLNYRPLLQDQNPINLGETFNLMCNKNDPCPQWTPWHSPSKTKLLSHPWRNDHSIIKLQPLNWEWEGSWHWKGMQRYTVDICIDVDNHWKLNHILLASAHVEASQPDLRQVIVREILLVLVQHAAPDNALVLLTIHRLTKEGWCTLCHSGSTTSMKQRPSQTPPLLFCSTSKPKAIFYLQPPDSSWANLKSRNRRCCMLRVSVTTTAILLTP